MWERNSGWGQPTAAACHLAGRVDPVIAQFVVLISLRDRLPPGIDGDNVAWLGLAAVSLDALQGDCRATGAACFRPAAPPCSTTRSLTITGASQAQRPCGTSHVEDVQRLASDIVVDAQAQTVLAGQGPK